MPLSAARNTFRDITRLLAPRPGRFEFSTRLGLICALTVLVAEIYQTPEPALTAYVVFFLNREDRTTSLILDFVLLSVFTFTMGLVMVVAMVVADDPMWRFINIAVLSFGFLFLASASKLRPVGSIIALIVGYALDVLGNIQLGEEATRGFLYVWLFVGIPAGVSIVVNLLLAPPPRRLAQNAIALRLGLSAAMLRGPDDPTRLRFAERMREGTSEIQSWLDLAKRERTSPSEDIAALEQAGRSTVALLSAIDVMDRTSGASLPASLREDLARTLDKMADILRSGGYPLEIDWQAPEVTPSLTPLAKQVLAAMTDAVVWFSAPPSPVPPSSVPPSPAPPSPAPAADRQPEAAHGFFVKDAFTNPDHVHYALKTTTAAMFCYVLYSLLDWPGIHTAFITCYIVSLVTAGESTEKLTLRIVGCLIGAAVGTGAIVFLVPSLTSIGALMIVVFLGAWACGYVAAGGPRISYAGFQMAFAFFLCVVQGAAPAFDLTIARDRVIGILIGNFVSYLVLTNIWPVSVCKGIDPAIAAVLRRLVEMMRAGDSSTRRTLAAQAEAELTAIDADLDLAHYEPRTIRPPLDWITARREDAREIGALDGPLLLTAGQDAAMSAHLAIRLEALAARFAVPETPVAMRSDEPRKEWSTRPLFSIVDSHLRRLEAIPTR
jgi:multidrug resistance protein MdtO